MLSTSCAYFNNLTQPQAWYDFIKVPLTRLKSMFIRNILKKIIMPSEGKVQAYLDLILAASNWAEMYTISSNRAGLINRTRLHAGIWTYDKTTKRILKYLATYSQDGTFYDKNQHKIEPTMLYFIGSGEELTADQSEISSRFSGLMLHAIVEQYPDLPDEVLTVLPRIAKVSSMYMDLPTSMLERVGPTNPLYPGALYTAYIVMRGVDGNRGVAAIESLRPYLLQSLPAGVIDACLLVEDNPDKVMEQLTEFIMEPTTVENTGLPKDVSF